MKKKIICLFVLSISILFSNTSYAEETAETIPLKNVSGATGYRIFRSTSLNGTYTRIKGIANGTTDSYADTTTIAGKTYYYKVRAYRKVNESDILSDFSDIVSKKAI